MKLLCFTAVERIPILQKTYSEIIESTPLFFSGGIDVPFLVTVELYYTDDKYKNKYSSFMNDFTSLNFILNILGKPQPKQS